MNLPDQRIARRRTFVIISSPDLSLKDNPKHIASQKHESTFHGGDGARNFIEMFQWHVNWVEKAARQVEVTAPYRP